MRVDLMRRPNSERYATLGNDFFKAVRLSGQNDQKFKDLCSDIWSLGFFIKLFNCLTFFSLILRTRIKLIETFLEVYCGVGVTEKKNRTGRKNVSKGAANSTMQQNPNLLKGLEHWLLSEPSLVEGEKVER